MSRSKLIFFKIISLTAAFFMTIIIAEIILRLAGPYTRIYYPAGRTFEAIYQSCDDYVYGLKPNTIYKHPSYYGDFVVTYRINSEGLRSDRDYGYKKPDGIKRILMLGDSYTFARGVENDETCAAVLENMFNRTGNRVEVLNSGVPGYSTDNEFLYLKRKGVLFNPDVIILMMFPRNDIMDMRYHDWVVSEKGLPEKIKDRYYAVDNASHLVDISSGNKRLKTSPIKEFIRNNSYIYTFLSEHRYYPKIAGAMLKKYFKGGDVKKEEVFTKAAVFTIEKAKPEEKKMIDRACMLLGAMKSLSDKKSVKFLLVVIPDSIYDDSIINFAKSKGIDIIDIGTCAKRDKIQNLYLPKDMHWSKSGNAYVADLIYKKLENEKF